uniref:Uncharacterized protein n=1 Tax=Amphimedon queenslandica TaxID=400682 RepID=A0A1X7VDX4_AMPQE
MASISSLVSYGGSDSESEEEERRGAGAAKGTAVSSKGTGPAGLIKHQKDKSGRVKVYLPELSQSTTTTRTDKGNDKLSSSPMAKLSGGKGLASLLPPPKKRKTTSSGFNAPPSSSSSLSTPPPTGSKGGTGTSGGLFVPYSLKKPNKRGSGGGAAQEEDDETDNNDFTSFLFLKEEQQTEPQEQLEDAPPTQSVDHLLPTGYQPVNIDTPLTGSSNIDVPLYGSGNVGTFSPPSLTGSSNIPQDTSSDDNLAINDDIVRRLAGKRRGQRLDDESLSILNVKTLTETDLKNSVNAFQKNLTEQSANSGTVPENLVYSSEAKRKHQITWLAHQVQY